MTTSLPAAVAWRDPRLASELARWTFARLVNRCDVWGGYLRDGTTTTRPAKTKRGKSTLTIGTLLSHYRSTGRSSIVGLHSGSVGPDATAKWIAADIDAHGDNVDAVTNEKAAINWYSVAFELGFHPLLNESNGRGGFHLRIIFAASIELTLAYKFARWLFRDATACGLPKLETFPKQPTLTAPGQPGEFGNWLRLPGRHHKRDFWSGVWDGTEWVRGEQATAHILALTGDDPKLIPEAATSLTDPKTNPPPTIHRQAFVIPGKTTAYAAAALRAECQRVASARASQAERNIQLNKSAFSLGRTFVGGGELDRHVVERELMAAAYQAGLPNAEVASTLRSGFRGRHEMPTEGCNAMKELSNYIVVEEPTEDGKVKKTNVGLSAPAIHDMLKQYVGDWPRRVGPALLCSQR